MLLATALLISLGMLSACATTGNSVHIPPGSEELEQCPPTIIDAEKLSALGEPGCDLVESTVLLPNGTSMEIDDVGVSLVKERTSESGTEYVIMNWGIPGVAVSVMEADEVVSQWHTSADAAELQRQLHVISGYKD